MECKRADYSLTRDEIMEIVPQEVWTHAQTVLAQDPSVVSRIVVDETGHTDANKVELTIAEFPHFTSAAVDEFCEIWKSNDPSLDLSPNPETIVPNLIKFNNWIFAVAHGLVASDGDKDSINLLKQWWVYWYVTYVTQNPGTAFNNVHLFILKPEGHVTYQAFYLKPDTTNVSLQ